MMPTRASQFDLPPSGHPAAGEPASEGFEELAARLEALAARAAAGACASWSETDTRALEAAAGEIRAIPHALARGMKEAFALGREYGHGEEALDELDREIAELSSNLARQAWGRRGPGRP